MTQNTNRKSQVPTEIIFCFCFNILKYVFKTNVQTIHKVNNVSVEEQTNKKYFGRKFFRYNSLDKIIFVNLQNYLCGQRSF